MKNSDLRTGMLVQLRNDDVYLIINDTLINKLDYIILDSYSDSMEYKDSYFDIMKVSTVLHDYNLMPSEWSAVTVNNNLLWKRKEIEELTLEQVCNELGREIKIVK